jgi:hypothetical protein
LVTEERMSEGIGPGAVREVLALAGWRPAEWSWSEIGIAPRPSYQFWNGYLYTLVQVNPYQANTLDVDVSSGDLSEYVGTWSIADIHAQVTCQHEGERLAELLRAVITLARDVTDDTLDQHMRALADICPRTSTVLGSVATGHAEQEVVTGWVTDDTSFRRRPR